MQSTKTRPRTNCGSDHELLIAKFRLKLKKVGKTTRPFRYDLKQKISRRGDKNTQKNCTKKIFMTKIITMV